MNPLDSLELQAFARKLNEEMPIHTETTAKIKRSYSQGMPKNLMEYSAHVDNKFLNDNLAIVEEIAHRDQKHPIPKWFRDYQIKHFAKYGILKADGFFVRDRFFGRMFPREIYHHASMSFHNPGFTSVIGNTKVLGSTIEAGTTGSTVALGANTLYCTKLPNTGVIGQYYDRVAHNWSSVGVGNYRLCIYSDNTTPDQVLAETASLAAASGFNWQNVTEVALITTQNWIGTLVDTGSSFIQYYQATDTGGKQKAQAYGAFPTAPGSLSDNGAITANVKIGHT